MKLEKVINSIPFLVISFIILLSFSVLNAFNMIPGYHYQVIDEQENVITTTDETVEWKTYKNNEYGFEFKYPSDWFVGPNKFDQRGAEIALVLCPQANLVDGDCGHTSTARMASTLGPIVFYVNTRNSPPADDSLNLSWKKGDLYYEFHLINITGAEMFDDITETFKFTN
jgi:hypothetical protein